MSRPIEHHSTSPSRSPTSTSTCPIAATARCACRTRCPSDRAAVRHHRPAVGVRPHHRRRAVQGPGAQPARRLVVRRDPPTSSPTTCVASPTRTCSIGRAAPRRCRSRSSCAATSPASRRRRCGSSTPTARATIYGHRPARRPAQEHRARPRRSSRRPPRPRRAATTSRSSCAEVVERGLVEPALWDQVAGGRARRCSRRGQRARRRGRAHPRRHQVRVRPRPSTASCCSSTRCTRRTRPASGWPPPTTQRLAAGEEPESLDKEVVRRALLDAGYDGDGAAARRCPPRCRRHIRPLHRRLRAAHRAARSIADRPTPPHRGGPAHIS